MPCNNRLPYRQAQDDAFPTVAGFSPALEGLGPSGLSRVADHQSIVRACSREADLDPAPRRRKLDGMRDQIVQHQLELGRIHNCQGERFAEPAFDSQVRQSGLSQW